MQKARPMTSTSATSDMKAASPSMNFVFRTFCKLCFPADPIVDARNALSDSSCNSSDMSGLMTSDAAGMFFTETLSGDDAEQTALKKNTDIKAIAKRAIIVLIQGDIFDAERGGFEPPVRF